MTDVNENIGFWPERGGCTQKVAARLFLVYRDLVKISHCDTSAVQH